MRYYLLIRDVGILQTKTNMRNTYVEDEKDLHFNPRNPHWLGRRVRFRGTFATVVAETAPKPCIGL